MVLRREGFVKLREHRGEGGFDHAAVHGELRRLYVAHTANDARDVIDLDEMRYVDSIDGLTGVAGALVAESRDLVFTSNRGEDAVGIFDARNPRAPVKVAVGRRPNGLAFHPVRRTLLVANVGDLNTIGNLASKSRLERTVFAATTAALAVLSAYVALS